MVNALKKVEKLTLLGGQKAVKTDPCERKYIMSTLQNKILSALLIAGTVLFCVNVSAQNKNELQINGDFYKLSDKEFKANWKQDDSFKPTGTVNISSKGVELFSTKAENQIYTAKAFPVKVGEHYRMQIYFNGKGTIVAGYYGYGKKGRAGSFAETFKPWRVNTDDRRSFSFTISESKVTPVNMNIFVGVAPDSKITVKYVKVHKMTKEEAKLYATELALINWHKKTKGINLAKNIKCTLIPKSIWKGVANNETDEYDLTDGKLIKTSQLWHYSGSFVWHRPPTGTILLDLKKEHALKNLVIRINGGKHSIKTPKKIEVFISKNGKEYYKASSLTLVNAAERSIVDWKKFYYLPHDDSNTSDTLHYVFPFSLGINADARYVAIKITKRQGSLALVSDELAIMQADAKVKTSPAFNQAYKGKTFDLAHETLKVRPRKDKIYIAKNMNAPQWFSFDDRRKNKKGKIKFIVDMPKGVRCIPESSWGNKFIKKFEKQEVKNNRNEISFALLEQINIWTRYYSYPTKIGPFFFVITPDVNVPKGNSYATLTTLVDGKIVYTKRFPLILFEMPVVPKLNKWSTSLHIPFREAVLWPEVSQVFRVIGMTDALFFMNPFTKNGKAYYDAAKKAGLKIRVFVSAGPWVNRRYRQEAKCVNAKSKKSVCPAYRGPGYKAMLDNITEIAQYYPADYFSFDQESWQPLEIIDMGNCSRCDSLRKKMKMTWKTYKTWVQADFLKPFKAAVAKGSKGHKMPRIGYYAISPDSSHNYGGTEFLGRSYLMEYFDEEMPSFYGRNSAHLSREIKRIVKAVKKTPHTVIACTTPAAYDEEHIPNRFEQTILEIFINGADGFVIYFSHSFRSPIDYLELVTALRILAPYEDFITSTENMPLTGSNKKLSYSARGNKEAQLLLIGNYNSYKDAQTTISLPAKVYEIIDLKTNKSLKPTKNLKIKIKTDRYRLFYVKYKNEKI